MAKKVASYLSGELDTKIEVESLYIEPFKTLVLEGLYVQDQQQDTLLYSPKFSVDISFFSLKLRKIAISNIQLDNGKCYLKNFKDNSTNLDFIIDYFSPEKPTPPSKNPYDITFDKISLKNFTFKYKNFKANNIINGINFDDILLTDLNTSFTKLNTKTHLLSADIKHLSFREKSGFLLKNLSTTAIIDSNRMEFKNLLLQTPKTQISNYLLLSYHGFNDFSHFVKKVKVEAQLLNTLIHPQDIAYFAPEARKLKLDVHLNGKLSGYVSNIKARNFSIRAGQATYLKGNFNIKGLPKLDETFLDLEFDQIASNKKDADSILLALTGLKGQIPQLIEKFGNINFKGRFTGFPKDFIAYGEFKTKLGRIVSDVNMKIEKVPVYQGSIQTYDFDLGTLFNDPNLGRTTANVKIDGKGFDQKELTEQLKGRFDYFDFKGYRYNDILIDGVFNKNLFTGQLNVNDRNIQLDFDGSMDFNPKLPQFNFIATIHNANLNKLNLLKDTIQVDAHFNTNFTGNSLDNIQGDFQLHHIKLSNPQKSLVIDGISLTATGMGRSRSLSINSDIVDASINGEYDLNTLPSYFKTAIKRFIPSWQTQLVKPAPQNFDFNLQLKNFEPISVFFFPELKIPEGGGISGKFTSPGNAITLNAYAPLTEYKGIKIQNFILDETTGDKALNIFITADKVNLTDSVYIQNVNIANILRNDSLNLNIKLSDKSANNQLDLNGLVQFNKDSAPLFSILPSDIIINNEIWKVQDQVKVDFEKGKTLIRDFYLSRNEQVITIDGAISDNRNDKLSVIFDKFNLKTLNPITQGYDLKLKGELNGGINIASVLRKPSIESALNIDSLNMNGTPIGDMTLIAAFDDETRLVNLNIDLLKEGKKTLNLGGSYDINSSHLNMGIKMENNQLVVFQPFVKSLISNLKGTISTNLTISGHILNPKIDGALTFNNAELTVNYLKTNYHFTDEIHVENSVIKLDNLVLKDIKNHEAIANGSINMKNPSNPDIDIKIDAKNFMALNTKAKDNPDYYGTAYGSGTFNFKGPTDNMLINIAAKTETGTVFNIPLNSASTVSDTEFITFVSKDSTSTPRRKNAVKGLTMNFDLVVDQNSEVNIFTDLGRLSGRGETELLNLKINSNGDFTMLGTYTISNGKFDFTAQDVINKVFKIEEGGTIRWTRSPTDAAIDLKTIYEVRTSPKDLYIAATGQTTEKNQQTLVQAMMNLNGKLLKPTISFDLNFPTDPSIKDELQGYLSDVNNRTQQALSIIVRRAFAPNTGLNLGTAGTSVANVGTELLFNQVNTILAQSLNLNFVDLNIKSLNQASTTIRLWNDRLVFTYGIMDNRNAEVSDITLLNNNSLTRDVEALYLIKKDGSLVARASNRLNNKNFLDPSNSQYVSAVGLVYRQEFDNLQEFLRMLIGKKRREERRKQETSSAENPVTLKPEETNSSSKEEPTNP